MKYREIADGIFVDRPNRFIAHVEVNGAVETVHVKNTGRCKELLLPGTAVSGVSILFATQLPCVSILVSSIK